MTQAARTTKATKAPATPVAAPSAQGAPTYALSAAALALAAQGGAARHTLQAPGKGLGLAWRAAGHKAPNTRAVVLAALLAQWPTGGFTAAQAQANLAAAVKAGAVNLGSGTPNSYCKAFIANGYFAPVVA